jgi:predicted alpha-1,6-mannanase (GH76 family)
MCGIDELGSAPAICCYNGGMIRSRLLALTLCVVSVSLCFAQSSSREARRHAELGVEALQHWYVERTGLYRTTGWWNSANAITAVTDYMRATGEKTYVGVLENTFAKAQVTVPIAIPKDQQTVDGKEMTGFPGFLNKYYDDEGWWALAWIDAYDLTHERLYLAMAQSIFDDMASGWDETCGGGIWWNKDRKYKNAIANELFLSVAAHLANQVKDAQYGEWTAKEWAWFKGSGMINDENLINDGLRIDAATGACTNNGKTVWTYNQGVVLGGLAEWSKAGHAEAIEEAKRIADAALAHLTEKDGVLHDPCEPKCGADGIQFKGIFMRNLRALDEVAPEARYRKAFAVNAEAIWTKDRTPENTFGTVWSGPVTTLDAGTQSSAVDALVAAIPKK